MHREKCKVLENKKVTPGHYVLRFASRKIPKNAQPGQFVQVLCDDSYEPLLPRPFSFLTVSKNDFSILYQVVGKGTQLLSGLKRGDSRWVIGPLGNGFSGKPKEENLVLVGGGVGIPPLYHLAEQLNYRTSSVATGRRPVNIHVFLGARHKSLLLCEKDFIKLGVDLKVTTDDGSKDKKGFVTSLLQDFLKNANPKKTRIFTCGPTPMLKAVSTIAGKYQVPCEVSVEVPMACGFGACLGCALKVRSKTSGHRFAIACCEGPVFEASEILWD